MLIYIYVLGVLFGWIVTYLYFVNKKVIGSIKIEYSDLNKEPSIVLVLNKNLDTLYDAGKYVLFTVESDTQK